MSDDGVRGRGHRGQRAGLQGSRVISSGHTHLSEMILSEDHMNLYSLCLDE